MRAFPLLLALLSLAACAGETGLSPLHDPDPDGDPLPAGPIDGIHPGAEGYHTPSDHGGERNTSEPIDAFIDAEVRFGVPTQLLVALAVEGTGHAMVEGQVEFEGQIPTHGIMALPDDVLELAAELADESVEDVLEDRGSNILATAALLSAWADEEDIARRDLGAWAPIVARYSGIEDLDGQAHYVHDQVYALLAEGIEIEGLRIPAYQELDPDFPYPADPPSSLGSGGDRSYAVWRASPNQSARPSGSSGKPSMVIIHTCEGGYAGCWSWLRNPRARVSAHYVVNSTGSETTQLVRESRKAWHISATYQCSRNKSTDCWRNGGSSNNFTIGIEHAGYASQRSWHPGLIAASTRLTCDITKTHGIPRDAYHIVGHGQLQPYNRTDPGKNWPWSTYLSEVRRRCGGGTSGGGSGGGGGTSGGTRAPAGTRVIDSNNSRNDTANQKIVVSGAWRSSASVRGYHGTGYWWRAVGASNDPARFRFRNDAKTCYAVQAWWPAASDRSRRAPWIIEDSSGKTLDIIKVDQRSRHARWVTLGTWSFPAGWNTVGLSRWTGSKSVVVADAVRLVPSSGCGSTSGGGTSGGGTSGGGTSGGGTSGGGTSGGGTSGGGTSGGGGSTSKPAINLVVDSTNSVNDTTKARVSYSRSWTAAKATRGYYGVDYVWASTDSISDTFKFQFKLNSRRRVRIQAHWTAGSNRATKAPFLLWSPSGTLLDRVFVDQTRNHGRWVTLGTWTLPAGWNRLDLSRWAPRGTVVVADAIRVQSVD